MQSINVDQSSWKIPPKNETAMVLSSFSDFDYLDPRRRLEGVLVELDTCGLGRPPLRLARYPIVALSHRRAR